MPNVSTISTLAESSAEALRALDSIIFERLGNANEGLSCDETGRNNRGELVNDEGLPIVEITEPVDELDTPSLTAASDEIVNDHYPEPLSKLSPETLALNREQRDKILQLLEEEEEREERRTKEQHRAELLRHRELARKEMEKRMLNQGLEFEKRREAKELEVRMAKALVGKNDKEAKSATISGSQRKKVTFAQPDKGAQSNPVQSRTKLSSKQPMKMEVIERAPVTLFPSTPEHEPYRPSVQDRSTDNLARVETSSTQEVPSSHAITFTGRDQDSDDESEPDDITESTASMEPFNENIMLSPKVHRELVSEYHRRRAALTYEPGDLLMQGKLPNYNQENVPLDASLAQPPPKPSVSKFKQSRIKQGMSKPFTGLATFETAVIPSEILSNSIRMGKVVDGQLTGHEDEMD